MPRPLTNPGKDPVPIVQDAYFSSAISRGACAAPERAAVSQMGPEPLVSIGATQSPLLARKESICFPHHRQGHRTAPSLWPSLGRAQNRSSGALCQRGRKASGEKWPTEFCLNDSTST
jgi:hypothetical protein